MIKLVIADDEKVIRAGIRKILASAFSDDVSIFDAKNGREALALCGQEEADILITDIRMPGMDGVSLMEHISSLKKKPRVIVLSGFEDFSYAKAAIANGAIAYILKPVDTAEFLGAVRNAVELVRSSEHEAKESALRNFVQTSDMRDFSAHFDKSAFKGGMSCLCASGKDCEKALAHFVSGGSCYVVEQKTGYLCLLVPAPLISQVESDPVFGPLVVGMSGQSDSPGDVRQLHEQANTALLSSFFAGGGHEKVPGIYRYEDLDSSADFARIESEYEKLVSYMELFHTKKVMSCIDQLFDFSAAEKKACPVMLKYLYGTITGNLFSRFSECSVNDSYLHAKEVMIRRIMQARSLSEWQNFVRDYVFYVMALLQKAHVDLPYMREALDYLDKHFMDPNLTMATVSNYVSVNYTWFSEKFKEHTGFTFNDYLKRLRMTEAKRLLETGRYHVYEVAQRCGYRVAKYFMKAFREETGLKPSEWVKTHGMQ